jgi:hypothetical protein
MGRRAASGKPAGTGVTARASAIGNRVDRASSAYHRAIFLFLRRRPRSHHLTQRLSCRRPFAPDSLLEEMGFEPSVSPKIDRAFEIALSPLRHSRSARETGLFCERDRRFESASLQR